MAKDEKGFRVGVDLGGTKIYAVVLNPKGEIIASHRCPTEGHEGHKKGLVRIGDTVEEALKEAGVKTNTLRGLGIGCPGIVDFESGILRIAPNLGWKDAPVGEVLQKRFGCPIAVLNDVDAGTYGEYLMGAGQGARSLFGAFPGTGLGGGFIYEGRILTGHGCSCMEFGHIRYGGTSLHGDRDEPPTLESLCSRLSISSAISIEAYRGQASDLVGLPITKIKSKAILKSMKAGNKAVKNAVENAVQYLGIGIAGIVDLLAPQTIVLGGGLVEKMPDIFVDGVKSEIKRLATGHLVKNLNICVAKLGDDAGVLGAAAYSSQVKS